MVAPSHCPNIVFCVALRRESIMARCSPAVKESAVQQQYVNHHVSNANMPLLTPGILCIRAGSSSWLAALQL